MSNLNGLCGVNLPWSVEPGVYRTTVEIPKFLGAASKHYRYTSLNPWPWGTVKSTCFFFSSGILGETKQNKVPKSPYLQNSFLEIAKKKQSKILWNFYFFVSPLANFHQAMIFFSFLSFFFSPRIFFCFCFFFFFFPQTDSSQKS